MWYRAIEVEALLTAQQEQLDGVIEFKDHCLQQAADAKVLLQEERRLREEALANVSRLTAERDKLEDDIARLTAELKQPSNS